MNSGLKRQKSISSQAASISAWWTVLDWPSIVAALSIVAIGAGEQLGGLEEDRRALVPGHARPGLVRLEGCLDRPIHLRLAALVPVAQHVAVIVGHHGLGQLAGADLSAADARGDVDLAAGHPLQLLVQQLTLRANRHVVQHRFVVRDGNVVDAVGHGPSSPWASGPARFAPVAGFGTRILAAAHGSPHGAQMEDVGGESGRRAAGRSTRWPPGPPGVARRGRRSAAACR